MVDTIKPNQTIYIYIYIYCHPQTDLFRSIRTHQHICELCGVKIIQLITRGPSLQQAATASSKVQLVFCYINSYAKVSLTIMVSNYTWCKNDSSQSF